MSLSLSSLWRYPIKSMAGETCEQVQLDLKGMYLDRSLALYTAAGKLGSGKNTRRFERVLGLLECEAQTRGDQIWLRVPNREFILATDPTIPQLLKTHFGIGVQLRPETNVPHFDDGAIHVVTTGTLSWIENLSNKGSGVRRLRPNIVIDSHGDSEHIEESWIGKTLRIGPVELIVTHATERCVMIGMQQEQCDHAPTLLKSLGAGNRSNAGVYAKVHKTGLITQGDAVEILGETK